MLNEVIIHLNNAMHAVQNLQIQPTEHNCEQILTAITGIREAAGVATKMNQKITELEKAAAPAGAVAETDAVADQAAVAETDAGADPAAIAETDAVADPAAAPDEFEDRER